jgi:uncharacterized protein YgiM (DUF1202 family)
MGLCTAALLLLPATLVAEDAYIVEMDGFSLRSEPKPGSPTTGRIKIGEKVVVTSRATGWVQVEKGELKGWLSESAVKNEPPASLRLGPMQERLAALESTASDLETEKKGLAEENARLATRVGELETACDKAKKEVAEVRSAGHFREIALGGALVIIGWLAGFAVRRRSGGRYQIE